MNIFVLGQKGQGELWQGGAMYSKDVCRGYCAYLHNTALIAEEPGQDSFGYKCPEEAKKSESSGVLIGLLCYVSHAK